MPTPRHTAALFLLLTLPVASRAGLYYSGEPLAELPSQWRGFLLDQRTLRSLAVAPPAGKPPSPARQHYLDAAATLEKAATARKLTADELADLGALYVRLGQADKAVALLRRAHQDHPNHFAIVANLGTASQAQGDLEQAALFLEQAVRLAPGKCQRAEEYHLKLVRQRLRAQGGSDRLDDLFGVRYVGESGKYEPGNLAASQKKKLPAHAPATAQQLALWLPADGRLLWQLGELANAYGDVKTAAAILDGCITQFALQSAELRSHRRLLREAADRLPTTGASAKAAHEQHAGTLPARSRRPLRARLDTSALPPISATEVNVLPWAVLTDTTIDRKHRPTFPAYLRELDGKRVTLTGFMQPLGEDLEQSAFLLIQYPVGCWYCEMPELTGIVYVELPEGKSAAYSRGLLRVTGRLRLNATDPEEFLFAVRQAKVADVD
jgi:tetratricopeptide (TPR) repeat protein